jgi:hypothetical protein
VLLRPLYRGEIVWNQSRKRDRRGQSKRSERPAADWLHVPAPSLQIVQDAVWTAAQTQFLKRQAQFANAGGRRLDIESRYQNGRQVSSIRESIRSWADGHTRAVACP